MDEILIDEKKYISSKQAAKVTGYAKDYVGQLCREGRVPARLVGRSWYVLESALYDHRFGNASEEELQSSSSAPSSSAAWQSPLYEADEGDILPTLHRARSDEGGTKGQNAPGQLIQDSWKEWFERVGAEIPATSESEPTSQHTAPSEEDAIIEDPAPVSAEKVSDPAPHTTVAIDIPLPGANQAPPEEVMLHREHENSPASRSTEGYEETGEGKFYATIQMSAILIAALVAGLSLIGTGNLDRLLISSSQARELSGVIFYNR